MRQDNKKKITIIGASGHGRVVADIAKLNGYETIEFLDDNEELSFCGVYPVVGKSEKAQNVQNDIFVAIGNADCRKRLTELFSEKNLPVLIHPKAIVSGDVIIGRGSVIMPGAVINSGATIGQGCIVNTSASVDHDCVVGDYVHVAVGAHLCGTVNVGPNTWIGAGSIVSNNIDICGGCTIGAGAVVVRSIKKEGVYVGVPACELNNDSSRSSL